MNSTAVKDNSPDCAQSTHASTQSIARLLWRVISVAAILVPAVAEGLTAATFNGRFATTCYGFEQQDHHVELIERFDLSIVDITDLGFSASTSFELKGDLAGGPFNTKLWSGFLDWQNGENHGRLGRQRITTCLSRISVDGILLGAGYRRMFSVAGFAGLESNDSLSVDSWESGHVMGARFSVLPFAPVRINMSWLRCDRQDDRYYELLGGNIRVSLARFIVRSALAYDIVNGSTRDFMVQVQYFIYERGVVSTDFHRRNPLFAQSSFFSAFSFEPIERARIGVQWKVIRALHIFGQYSLLNLDGDQSHGADIWFGNRFVKIGYAQYGGYGGELSGITCSARTRWLRRLELSGSGRLGWYTHASCTGERHNESAVRVGARYEVGEKWSFGVCGEHMSGRRYRSDFRILLRMTLLLEAVL
jgi:hypothetical protein